MPAKAVPEGRPKSGRACRRRAPRGWRHRSAPGAGEAHQNEPQRGVGMDLGNEPEMPDHVGRQHRPAAQRRQTRRESPAVRCFVKHRRPGVTPVPKNLHHHNLRLTGADLSLCSFGAAVEDFKLSRGNCGSGCYTGHSHSGERGGTGRRTGFRFQRLTAMWVRPPPFAPPKSRTTRRADPVFPGQPRSHFSAPI